MARLAEMSMQETTREQIYNVLQVLSDEHLP
jgi:hypothetical protein